MPWWVDALEAAAEWGVYPEDLLAPEGDEPPKYNNLVIWLIRRREWRNAQAKRQELAMKTR